jgi:hypothetical protein
MVDSQSRVSSLVKLVPGPPGMEDSEIEAFGPHRPFPVIGLTLGAIPSHDGPDKSKRLLSLTSQ